jgi:hypothetical protein
MAVNLAERVSGGSAAPQRVAPVEATPAAARAREPEGARGLSAELHENRLELVDCPVEILLGNNDGRREPDR